MTQVAKEKLNRIRTMKAFHDDPAIKTKYLDRVQAHRAADELLKGVYWQNGKGCAVGCTIHSDRHGAYETELGVPQMLARLEDCIFEGLPNAHAQEWPAQFLSAIPVGADLSRVGWQFLHWLLTDSSVNPGINHPVVKDAVQRCADVVLALTRGEAVDRAAAYAAACAAYAAYAAARSAANSADAAGAAVYAAAYAAARSAAYSADAADAAAYAAYAAVYAAANSAARSAAYAADAAYAAARSAANSAAWLKMADKLIQLLQESVVSEQEPPHSKRG